MSKITIELEAAVARIVAETSAGAGTPTRTQRLAIDRAFATIQRLIAPRIRHFIRQYGLVAHWEDAEQCCAIAVHRAILGYDPEKAQFTTFVNWQIRGELQGLRFRLMTDQRPSARKVAAVTVSLHATTGSLEGDDRSLESLIEDENACARTESAASDYLAKSATISLVDELIADMRRSGMEQLHKRPRAKRPAGGEAGAISPRRTAGHGIDPIELQKLDLRLVRDRNIVESRIFEIAQFDASEADGTITNERVRQITKRATRSLAALAQTHPRFEMMANYRKLAA